MVGVNDESLPAHVRGAFGATDGEAVPVVAGSGTGWLVSAPGGPVVLRPVADTALGNWSARVRETLDVTGLRVAPPVRSSDGTSASAASMKGANWSQSSPNSRNGRSPCAEAPSPTR